MDKCKKDGGICIYSKECFEPEDKKIRTNFEMVKEMSLPELAAWVAVQIRQYYLADNTVIFEEEVEKIAHTYIEWLIKEVKK